MLKSDAAAIGRMRDALIERTALPALEAPWALAAMLVLALLHPLLGAIAVLAAALLLSTAILQALPIARLDRQRLRAADRVAAWWRGLSAAPLPPESASEREFIARITRAYETGDIDDVVALLTDDVMLAMPPLPLEYQGLELAARFLAAVVFRQGRTYRLVPIPANGQLALGAYLPDPGHRDRPRQQPPGARPRGRPDRGHDPFRRRRAPALRAPAHAARLTAGLARRQDVRPGTSRASGRPSGRR